MLSGTLLKMSHSYISSCIINHYIVSLIFSGMYNTLRIYFNVCFCFIVSLTLQQDHSASHLLELADNPRPLLVSWPFTLFFFHLGVADSKQEEFQEGKWSDTICYYFVVKFALLCSLDNFCQHCYSELTPTT